MIQKSKKIITTGLVTTIVTAYIFNSYVQAQNLKNNESSTKAKLEAYIKFTQILNVIEQEYVDEVNTTVLINKALKGLMSNLDAHSAFMDAKSYNDLDVQTKGEFGGLGISVTMRNGALTVIAPLDGTPADKAGVKAGDIILKIDDKATIGMNIDDAVKLMRGKPKTDIILTIVRKGETKPLKIKIARDIIKIDSVYAKNIEKEKDIAYIKVTSFDQNVVKDVKKSLSDRNSTKGIILDLRNNPGGLLSQAIGLVDMFVDHGVIVSQKGRDKAENMEYNATKPNSDLTTPIVTLVNGGSASASEIVSGALQDFKRSIVVGEKTFGKGSVQIVMPLNKSKEALKLTVARYYLPSGRTIQNKGVTPDIIVHYGKVPKAKDDSFMIKENELKAHLKAELAKLDGNTTVSDMNATDDNNIKNLITTKMLYNDSQLKSGLDILKALIITNKGSK
jgi:carboxyl-terminal processing protease